MAEVSVSKSFNAPQQQVWDVISNPTRFEEWLTLHQKWKSEPPTQLQKGSTMSEVLSIMNMPNTIDFTVTEYDAPNSTSFSGTGMAGAKITFTLKVVPDTDTTCNAHVSAEFVSQMMVGAVGAAIERASKKELDASLDELAEIVG